MPDPDFLQYARHRDPEAFGRLAHRHLSAVHSAAERVLGQRGALAEDVAQSVFILLARKAPSLPEDILIGAWLHRQTVRRALNLVRAETRRERREDHFAQLESRAMNTAENDQMWRELRPRLDRALLSLPDADRRVLVLRYLDRRPLAEVGAALGVTSNAAQKRVSKAVEALRRRLLRHRIVLPAAVLSALLTENAVQAAPLQMTVKITAEALAAAALPAAGPFSFLTAMITAKTTAAAALLVLCAGAGWHTPGTALKAAHPVPARLPQDQSPHAPPAPGSAWLTAIGRAKAEDFPRLAEEALTEKNLLRRHDRLEAVFARWAEVGPHGGWAWVREKFPEDLRDPSVPRDPRLAFLLSWVSADAPAACAALQESGKTTRFRRWDRELAERWAKDNPRGLLDFIASGRWEDGKEEAAAEALKALAADGPERIYGEALKLPDSYVRTSVIKAVAEAMARRDAEKALLWVREVPPGSHARRQAYESIFGVMGGRDPARAAKLMDEILTGELAEVRQRAARPVLEAWMKTDSAAALKWALTLGSGAAGNLDGLVRPGSPEAAEVMKAMKPGGDRGSWESVLSRSWTAGAAGPWLTAQGVPKDEAGVSMARSAVAAWVREDAKAAAAWVDQLPSGGKGREELRGALLSAMAAEGAPEALMLEQLGKLEETPEDAAVRQTAAALGAERPAEVLAVIGSLPGGEKRDAWLAETAGAWAERDPAAAAAWADAVPPPETRAKVTSGVLKRWWPDDPPAAERWAAAQPEGEIRDAAFSRVAKAMTPEAPERAFAWAAAIAGDTTRVERLSSVLKEWAQTDPAGALAALEAAPLAEDEKARLSRHTGPQPSPFSPSPNP